MPDERHRSARCDAENHRTRRGGQSLVELALLAPLLIFMLVATVDFARAFSAHIEVSNAARAGAIYGSRSSSNAHDATAVRAAALAENPSIFGAAPTVSSATSIDADGYEQITVTVDYSFNVLAGFPGIPDSVELSRSVQMRIVG